MLTFPLIPPLPLSSELLPFFFEITASLDPPNNFTKVLLNRERRRMDPLGVELEAEAVQTIFLIRINFNWGTVFISRNE